MQGKMLGNGAPRAAQAQRSECGDDVVTRLTPDVFRVRGGSFLFTPHWH